VSIDAPIVWDGIELEVAGGPPDEKPLLDWTTKWLDIGDVRYDESAEFQEVVHSVTPPTIKDAGSVSRQTLEATRPGSSVELLQILARDTKACPLVLLFFRTANETAKIQ
jgi:hypothetical protein